MSGHTNKTFQEVSSHPEGKH